MRRALLEAASVERRCGLPLPDAASTRSEDTPGQPGLGTSFHLATNGQQETDGRQALPVYGKMQRRGVERRWVLGGRCGER